jgi:hypothetical protein
MRVYLRTDSHQINMEKLADLTGYTPGSASVTFGNIKRKLKLLGEDLAANGPATPKKGGGPGRSKTTTPKSTGKRAAPKATGKTDESPTKRTKKNAPKKMRDNSDDDDDEQLAPRVKKEEVNDIIESADNFYSQIKDAASGYDPEQDGDDDLTT